jgi:hypothetical protein
MPRMEGLEKLWIKEYILKLPFTRVFHNYVLTMLQHKNVEPEIFGY